MMKPLLSRLLLIAALSLGLPALGSADPLNGVYSILFDAPFSIWDVGEIDECEVVVEPGVNAEICTAMDFERDAKGRLFGTGQIAFDATVEGIDLEGMLAGTLKGKNKGDSRKGTKLSFSFKLEGPVTAIGQGEFDAKATGKFKGEIDLAGNLLGTLEQTVCLKGVGCEKVETTIVDTASGGPWELDLVIGHANGKLLGTGTATLSDGTTREMLAKGKYKEGKGSSVSLKGDGEDKGASVKLKKIESSGPGVIDSGEAKYKLDGYKGKRDL
jgi:hypothetical protein